jgi:hypothetical protein
MIHNARTVALALIVAVRLAATPEPAPISGSPPLVESRRRRQRRAAPAEPTPEELKKAGLKSSGQIAKLRSNHAAELQRWTPELRAEAKALAEKKYPNAEPRRRRSRASRLPTERDAQRHPLQTSKISASSRR